MKIICLFNLQQGVDVGEYEEWARTRDIPAVKALGSIRDFSVLRSTGVFGDENAFPPYQYVEIIEVTGIDAFVADVSAEDFQKAAAPFRGFADAPVFILTEAL